MYKVEGFEFVTEEQARKARKEAEGIRYIRSQTNMKDAVSVLKLHNRLLQKEVFTTPVGFAFLTELRAYLNTISYIDSADIEPMPHEMQQELLRSRQEEERLEKERREKRRLRRRGGARGERPEFNFRAGFFVSTLFAGILALSLVGMFVIAILSKDNVNIINYENELINRYELWEQELDEREERLRGWEQELNAREERLQGQDADRSGETGRE